MAAHAPSLTDAEKGIATLLTAAWNEFLKLPGADAECQEFQFHLHALQMIIGFQVAKRANPEFWRTQA